jgi:hypothetical protein
MISADNIETLKVILDAVSALVGVVGVVWMIIWAIRGPRLNESLLESRGDLTRFGDSPQAQQAYFYSPQKLRKCLNHGSENCSVCPRRLLPVLSAALCFATIKKH